MKKISTTDDLAINGAPPAFPEMLHVGSPNIGPREKLDKYIDGIYERNWLTNDGPLVKELESRICQYHQVDHCVAMINGTVALEIAIRAVGLQGEVIVPSYTFIATAHALHWQAIKPVFADIDPKTHTLDPAAVYRMITPQTSGIIGVHLWGRAAPVDELEVIANDYNLQLIFDAAHAFGCSHGGRMIGGFGRCEVLSFHATKFFNSFEGGAVLTNDDALAEKMRLMRNFGFQGMDNVIHPGTNGKMNEVCAAMGLVNLENIEDVKTANQHTYESYRRALGGLPGIRLLDYDDEEKNNYQYIVMELDAEHAGLRDDILQALHAENVRARKYFWPGCHRMKPYRDTDPDAGINLRHTEDIAARVLVLPAGSAVDDDAIETIVKVIQVLLEDGS